MRLNLKVLNLVQKRNFQASKACQILKQEHLDGWWYPPAKGKNFFMSDL